MDTYRDFNATMVADLRAHAGIATQGPMAGSHLLLLTTVGARSGRASTVPVAYTRDGDDYVVIASKGGAPTHPAWYHNLVATSSVTVEVEGEAFAAIARPVTDRAERRRLYDAQASVMPGFKDYEARTPRVIPVVRLERIGVGSPPD